MPGPHALGSTASNVTVPWTCSIFACLNYSLSPTRPPLHTFLFLYLCSLSFPKAQSRYLLFLCVLILYNVYIKNVCVYTYICVCLCVYIHLYGGKGRERKCRRAPALHSLALNLLSSPTILEHTVYFCYLPSFHQVHSLAGFLTYLNRKSPTDVRSPFRVYRLSTPPPQPGTFPSVLVMKEMTRLLFLWSLPKHNSDTPKHLQAAAFSDTS